MEITALFLCRELPNGSILHKRLRHRYDVGEYEIYYYSNEEDGSSSSSGDTNSVAGRHYRVCSLENEARVVELSTTRVIMHAKKGSQKRVKIKASKQS